MPSNTFLSAEWRYLAMINYEVDAHVLQPYVPSGTELDSWNDKIFASMVGFLFLKTKVLGLSIPFHTDFEEVNLRFYVRRRGPEGWRRGVVFIKELVPKVAIATVAQVVYGEKYQALPMRHTLERAAGTAPYVLARYSWRAQGQWHHLSVKTEGAVQPITSGSEEEFIAEHYWGYSSQQDGGCVEYQVRHPRWRVWQVAQSEFSCNVAALYGPQFVDYLATAPSSAFLAEGSAVTVQRGIKI